MRVLSANSLIVRAVLRGVCDVLGLVLDNEWMYSFDLNVREATPLGVGDCLVCIHTAVLAGCIRSEYVLLSLHLFDLVLVWLAVRVAVPSSVSSGVRLVGKKCALWCGGTYHTLDVGNLVWGIVFGWSGLSP